MKKVSVIVPAYNAEKYIDKCLDSLVNQTLKDIEIIVVNDGSTDKTQTIINKYAKKYKNVVSIEKENGGQSSARNIGINNATGEYISFVDSDDFVELNTYDSLLEYMEKDYDIIIFDYKIIYSNYIESLKTCFCLDHDNVSEKEYLLCPAVSPCNKIYKREYLKKCEFKFPEKIIYEDYASIPTLVLNNPKIGYVEQFLYNYIQSDESTMRTMEYKTKYEDLFPATEYLYNKLKNNRNKDEVEFLICMHNLFHGALNFYKYGRYEQIDRISDSIREKFPRWKKNKYIKKENLRTRVLMHLFYAKNYKMIKLFQKLKGSKAV